MAIKKISEFTSGIPTASDKILFEQNGEGKSTTLANLPIQTKVQTELDKVQTELDKKVQVTTQTLTCSTWAYDSILYLGISKRYKIISIKIDSGGTAISTSFSSSDTMWYAIIYDTVGNRIKSGTITLEVTYI